MEKRRTDSRPRIYFVLATVLIILFTQTAVLSAAPSGNSDDVVCTSDDLIRACDTNGHVNTETALGDLTADAVKTVTGSDIALIPSGEFGLNIQQGAVTSKVIDECFIRNDTLTAADITVSKLFKILESSAQQLYLKENLTVDWDRCPPDAFLQISGINIRLDTAAPAGEKIMSTKLPDGTVLDRDDDETVLKCAGTVSMFEGKYGHETVENFTEGVHIRDAVSEYFRSKGTIRIPADGKRTELLGTTEVITTNGRMIGFLIVIFGVIITFTARRIMKKEKKEETVGVPYGYKDSEEE